MRTRLLLLAIAVLNFPFSSAAKADFLRVCTSNNPQVCRQVTSLHIDFWVSHWSTPTEAATAACEPNGMKWFREIGRGSTGSDPIIVLEVQCYWSGLARFHFCTGEYAGRCGSYAHWGCGNDPKDIASNICSPGTVSDYKVLSISGGNRCGYGKFQVDCRSLN